MGRPESEAPSASGPTVEERGSEEASGSVKSRKGPRRRTRQKRETDIPEQPGLNDEDENTHQEQVAEQHGDLKSTSKDALIVENPPASERKKRRRGDGKGKSRRRATEQEVSKEETEADVEVPQVRRDGVLDSSVDGGLPPPQSEGTLTLRGRANAEAVSNTGQFK